VIAFKKPTKVQYIFLMFSSSLGPLTTSANASQLYCGGKRQVGGTSEVASFGLLVAVSIRIEFLIQSTAFLRIFQSSIENLVRINFLSRLTVRAESSVPKRGIPA
jgi:hypothetical protein